MSDAAQKKSGLRVYKPGEVMFHENDVADSLFIIQKGQIRLYRPKGRGFVDLAILRAGEVIGEMAYFDEKSRRRSCSAAAIITTEVIEISFVAFEKTMSGLNPWFKTIINTLANRLRKTNERVKELEGNSVGFGKEGKVADYVFFHNADILKLTSTFYLVMKTHGDEKEGELEIHLNKLKFYILDIYAISEIKYEEYFNLLKNTKIVTLHKDEDGLMKQVRIADIEQLRSILMFVNTQRMVEDSKKIKISNKCEIFLEAILKQLKAKRAVNPQEPVDISAILTEFKQNKIAVADEDLRDAITSGLCQDILVGTGNKLTSVVNYDKLKKVFPSLKMVNAINEINQQKATDGRKGY